MLAEIQLLSNKIEYKIAELREKELQIGDCLKYLHNALETIYRLQDNDWDEVERILKMKM